MTIYTDAKSFSEYLSCVVDQEVDAIEVHEIFVKSGSEVVVFRAVRRESLEGGK